MENPHFLSTNALKAFHDKRITVEQFSTLTNVCPLLTEFRQASVRVQSLFNPDGIVNADAKKKVSQGPHNNLIDGFRVLDSFKEGINYRCMIPSLSIIQVRTAAYAGPDSVVPRPTIGASTRAGSAG